MTSTPTDPAAAAGAPRRAFAAGVLAALPFVIVVVPFALVFGVVAVEAGLSLPQIMGFSILVLAGASQITAVQLLADGASLIVVLASALAVNLRMAMYSAALTPWIGRASPVARALTAFFLIDQTFTLSLNRYEAAPDMTLAERLAFFAGTSAVLAVPWPFFTWVGATLGRSIPESFALDFAVPITFLALVAPQLRSLPHAAAAGVGFALALVFAGLPSGLGLMVAAPVAMAVGAGVEARGARRQARAGRA